MRKQPRIIAAFVFVSLFGSAYASPAAAQTSYKADDIVKHFAPAQPQLGASRGLCVGTEAECSKAGHAVKPVATAFDLVVKFKYNSDILEAGAKSNLDEFAAALKAPQLASARFFVEGHTDATGTPGYNLNLSERRAQAVVRYLNERGVAATKLAAKGYGETKPIVQDRFSGDNRRVETRLRVE